MGTQFLDVFLLDPRPSVSVELDYVRTWLEYKLSRGVNDPDSSEQCRDFYQSMWGNLLRETGMKIRSKSKRFSRNPSKYVQGDFMCSVATLFRRGLMLFIDERAELKSAFPAKVRGGVGGYRTYAPILLEDMDGDRRFQEFWGNKSLQRFVKAAYTPANLIIVPDGFNCARLHDTEDFWDRTLHLYFEQRRPLTYRTIYDVATPFHRLMQASIENNDALFMSDWLDESGNTIMLPNRDLVTLEKWHKLLNEMTRRIYSRHNKMQKHYPAS